MTDRNNFCGPRRGYHHGRLKDALLEAARGAELNTRDYLAANDSYPFFDRIGGLLRTGPTNTNVCDLQVVLVR